MKDQKSLRMSAAVPALEIWKNPEPVKAPLQKRLPDLKKPLFVYGQDAKMHLSDYAPKAFLLDEMG